MRKKLLISSILFLLFSLLFLFVSSHSIKLQGEYITQSKYVPNEVLVKFKEDIDIAFIKAAINSVQGRIITNLENKISPSACNPTDISQRSFRLDPNLFHIKVPENIGTEQAIYLLKLNPNVRYAEENIILHILEEQSDPDFYLQWALHNIGNEGPAQGTLDADIDAPEAWNIFTGSSNIVVAVIDTGVDLNHEDLAGNFWQNPGEIRSNGKDDDNNGYVDDVCGWDFIDNDWIPLDENGHGTHVAGIIGARTNNGKGIKGINWNVKIMVLRIGNEYGDIFLSKAIKAIDYSTENGAHLSNDSWGGGDYSQSLYDAIKRAKNAGKLFIAACGNDGSSQITYPARYDLENIISVLATDHNDNIASYSNYNSVHVDLGAPGGFGPMYTYPDENDIYSTLHTPSQVPPPPSNRYGYKYGTSMAAPHVAGVAALIWGYPIRIWWDQAKEIILDNVDHLPSLSGKCLTGGRLNAYNPFTESSPYSPSNLYAWPTAWTQISLSWNDNSNNEVGFEIQRKKEGENDFSTIEAKKENINYYNDNTASGGIAHYYKVRAYNLGGNSPFSDTIGAVIPAIPPAAPSDLRGLCGALEVQLTWHDSSNNELCFLIERSSFGEPWEEIGEAGPNETLFYDRNIQPNQIYYYRVRAYNPCGYSSYSNTIMIEVFGY